MVTGGVQDTLISRLKDLVWSLEQEQQISNQLVVPATIFSSELSPLQSLVTYLKDVRRFSFKEIGQYLQRAYATVYAAYTPSLPAIIPTEHRIPLSTFSSGLSVLETCVLYLKEHQELKLSEIARLLHKDPRTIWSTYDRAKKKQHASTN